MVFSSITFLFYFLPIFLAAYFLLPFKNTVLLIASLLFYAWGETIYVLLLLFSIVLNYVFGLLVNSSRNNKKQQRFILAVGVTANLSLISYFKYFNFLAGEVLGIETNTSIHLPLGISFFTFQAISYLVDVYRKDAKAERNLFNLGLYISMFPQLIAGPIVRFKTVAQQITTRVHSVNGIHQGVKIFVLGLAQKVLIANYAAIPADTIFGLGASELTTSLAWLGAFCYAIQIFFDFAGYSNMAIGLGLILGFTFPINFNYPYVAQSVTEFWQRWHISLSTWFRDYLYIPLGGNRVSKPRTYFNLFIVFLLCGLWHGAAWVFIIWGIYHGAFLVLERAFLGQILDALWRPIRHLYLLLVVLVGWVIFRVENLSHLKYYLLQMFGLAESQSFDAINGIELLSNSITTALIIGVILAHPVYPMFEQFINSKGKRSLKLMHKFLLYSFEAFCLVIFIVTLSEVASGGYNPFIYFRF